jgi:hypothetical protein
MRRQTGEDGRILPRDYLEAIDILLTDEASLWLDQTPEVKVLLDLNDPNHEDVQTFKEHFILKYLSVVADVAPRTFYIEI